MPCNRGERVCSGRDVYRCGSGAPAELIEECTGTTACDRGWCAEACTPARPSSGCSFLAVTTLSSRLGASAGPDGSTVGSDGYDFGIVVSNQNDYDVSVRVEGPSTDVADVVAAQSAIVVAVPWVVSLTQATAADLPVETASERSYESTRSSLASRAAYRVTSDAPVVAYQFNPYNRAFEGEDSACHRDPSPMCAPRTSDASLLLPTTSHGLAYTVLALGSRYVMGADCAFAQRPADTMSGFVTVAAGEAGAEVTITAPVPIRAGPGIVARTTPLDPFTVVLEPFDVLQLVADRPTLEECTSDRLADCTTICTYTGDLTGTTIESSAPIAVFAGHDCARAPYDASAPVLAGCDHLEDQLWPDATLGQRYVAMPLFQQRGERVATQLYVVGTRDHTTVTLSPPVSGTSTLELSRGEAVQLDLFAGTEIAATEVIAVAVVSPTAGLERLGEMRLSDPSLVVTVPVEQWVNEYGVYVADTFTESYLAIAAPTGASIRLDGLPLEPFETLGDHDFYHPEVTPGVHRVTSRTPFTAIVSGHAADASYAYPAGGALDELILE